MAAFAARAAVLRPGSFALTHLLLVGAISCADALAVATVAEASQAVLCPEGFYRSSTLVFACDKEGGQAGLLLHANASEGTLLAVPRGVGNLSLSVEASTHVLFAVIDPGASEDGGAIVVDAGGGKAAASSTTATWRPKQHGRAGAGVNITITRDAVGKAALAINGTTPSELVVRLSSAGASAAGAAAGAPRQSVAVVAFRYEGLEGCPRSPVGCTEYDPLAARAVVYNWSTWASANFTDAEHAWQGLCSDILLEAGLKSEPLQAPFHVWQAIWSKWPASDQSKPGWQATFKYIDSLGVEDDLVMFRTEFAVAYNLAGIGFSIWMWCGSLHRNYANLTAAWHALSGAQGKVGANVNFTRWQYHIWSKFEPRDNFGKASPSESFKYVDASSDGVVSRQEIKDVWESCHDSYNPDPTLLPTVSSTSISRATHPGSITSTTPSVTKPSTSTSTTTLLADHAKAEVEASSKTTTTFHRQHSNTTTTTRNPRPVAPATACCDELEASCLACQAGLSLAAFCDDVALGRVPGCQLAALPTLNASAYEHAGCPYQGIAYGPPMPGHRTTTEESPGACQARCRATLGCAYFSFWWLDRACVLQGLEAQWSQALGAISGPGACTVDVQLRISGVDFHALTNTQRRFLAGVLAIDLADATGIDGRHVKDLDGNPASMSLTSGSLVAGSHVVLPPGYSVANMSVAASRGDLRSRLAGSVAAANASRGTVPDGDTAGIDVSVSVCAECFLPRSSYKAATPGLEDASVEVPFSQTTDAHTAGHCQAKCARDPSCSHFTFWRRQRRCLLLGGPVAVERDSGAVAGPQACSATPGEAAAASPALSVNSLAEALGGHGMNGPGILLLCQVGVFCVICVTVACCSMGYCRCCRPRRGSKAGGPNYMALSREDPEENDEGSQDFDGHHEANFSREDHDLRLENPENTNGGGYTTALESFDEVWSSRRSLTPRCANAFLGPEALRQREAQVESPPPEPKVDPVSSLSNALFNMLDRDHDGYITRNEWNRVMSTQREAASPQPPPQVPVHTLPHGAVPSVQWRPTGPGPC